MNSKNHPLQCRCGTLRGHVSRPESGVRAVCYCRDCQAYAHALGQSADILDAMGGTEVVAVHSGQVTFTHGVESLACLSLTPNGLLRWYAGCCKTPVANTLRDYRVAYVGLVHNCLEDSATTLEDSFGPVRMVVNTRHAKGRPGTMPMRTFATLFLVFVSLIGARLSGSYRRTPFFDPQRGTPVVAPKVLTRDERDRAMNAV